MDPELMQLELTKHDVLMVIRIIEFHQKNPLFHLLSDEGQQMVAEVRANILNQYLKRDDDDARKYFQKLHEEGKNA